MDAVTGAVVIAGLQKFGGPASGVVKDFVTKVLSPTGEALGSVLAHPVVEWPKAPGRAWKEAAGECGSANLGGQTIRETSAA